jgi:hypothetical protein
MILRPYTVTVLKHPKKSPVSGLYEGKTVLVAGPEVYLAKNTATAVAMAARALTVGVPNSPPEDINELDFQVMEMGTAAACGGGLDF